MWIRLLIFAVAHVIFAALYHACPDRDFDPRLQSFSDALFYSIQTQARVGESQFVADGELARALTTVQIYLAIVWLFEATAKVTADVFYSRVA